MRNKLPLPDPSLHLHSVQCSVTTHCPQQSPPSKLCNAIFRASLQNPSPANILCREFTDFLSYLYVLVKFISYFQMIKTKMSTEFNFVNTFFLLSGTLIITLSKTELLYPKHAGA